MDLTENHFFRWSKNVDLSFCLIVPSGYTKRAGSGRTGKEKKPSESMPFIAGRKSSLPNKSLVPLVTWSSATFFIFFLSKFSLAKAVMVVLQIV